MHLDHVPRARALVEAVDVLGHDRLHEPELLESRERTVRVVRLGIGEHGEPARVELPDAGRVAPEPVDARHLHRVVARPDPLARAKVRDPALRGHARSGQDDARLSSRIRSARSRGRHARNRKVGRMEGFNFSTEVVGPLRRDGRAGDRASRLVRGLARGRARRLPRGARRRLSGDPGRRESRR